MWRFCHHVCGPYIFTLYDNESDDEELDEDDIEKPWVVNMGEFLTLDDSSPKEGKRSVASEGEKCRNPSLGLATKARVCKVGGKEEARE